MRWKDSRIRYSTVLVSVLGLSSLIIDLRQDWMYVRSFHVRQADLVICRPERRKLQYHTGTVLYTVQVTQEFSQAPGRSGMKRIMDSKQQRASIQV